MFYSPESYRTFSRFTIGFCIFLLLVLGAAEYFPLYADYPDYINQAGLQRTRMEVLTSSMIILEYRTPVEQANAVATIETTLPILRKEQATLLDDPMQDIQSLVQQSQPSYLDNPTKPVNPVQVNIMIAKHDAYRLIISQIVTTLIQHENNSTRNLFYVKTGIAVALVLMGLIYWIVLEQRMRHVIQVEQQEQAKKEEGLATGGGS